jgi:hypothetical protein
MPPSRLTFQVAIFGPPGAGKTSTLRGLHRILPPERLGALVEIPAISPYFGTVMFFDYRPAEFTKPSVTFRFRTVSGIDQEGLATLFGADALIFVADSRPSKRKANHEALSRAMEHFRKYPPSWASLPIVAQLTHVDELGSDLPNITSILKIDEFPCVKTDPRNGDGLRSLAETIMREVMAAFREGRVAGKPTRRLSKKYLARANALAAAVDIAAIVRPTGAEALETATKLMALHPELGFESLRALPSWRMISSLIGTRTRSRTWTSSGSLWRSMVYLINGAILCVKLSGGAVYAPTSSMKWPKMGLTMNASATSRKISSGRYWKPTRASLDRAAQQAIEADDRRDLAFINPQGCQG